MILLEANRRIFLGSCVAIAVLGIRSRAARAQFEEGILDPVLEGKVWRDPAEFRRLERLAWTAYELKYVYRDRFEEQTKSELPEPARYSQTISRLMQKGPEAVPGPIPSQEYDAAPSFDDALKTDVPVFQSWLESIGIVPYGPLATQLVIAQALLSLLGLIFDKYPTLEDRRAAGDSDCAIFYPFC